MKNNQPGTGKVQRGIILVFLLLMVILNIVFVFRFRHLRENNQIAIIKAKHKIEELQSLNDKLRYMIYNNLYSESSLLNPNICLTDVDSKSKISLEDFVLNGPVLFLRFTEYSCHVCVEQALKKVHDMNSSFKTEKFVILASYENLRDLLLFKKNNNIDYPIFTIYSDTLSIPIETLNFPYFFILNKNFQATNIFYPLTSLPELTDDYFGILRKKYPILFKLVQ
ncbi:MAG: hypothetical protein J7K53_02490 [Bacteroidales bacterium]|nr:hypothetical protein [Bacteroidales bacterium]